MSIDLRKGIRVAASAYPPKIAIKQATKTWMEVYQMEFHSQVTKRPS